MGKFEARLVNKVKCKRSQRKTKAIATRLGKLEVKEKVKDIENKWYLGDEIILKLLLKEKVLINPLVIEYYSKMESFKYTMVVKRP